MSKVFTCEGCEGVPDEVHNFDLFVPDGEQLRTLRTTLCPECYGTVIGVAVADPRSLAMINRVLDFHRGWPDKAGRNLVMHAALLASTEPEKAVAMVAAWSKAKRVAAGAQG